MADNDPPGFLSKVVRFVRNPLTNWSELEQVESDKENSYSKAALKAMIERKRRNDFIRRREFDQLRKLRSRGGRLEAEAGDRLSSFQGSSLPSNLEERAGTLRKIDEIEAQMSQQWWTDKAAAGASGAPSPAASQADDAPSALRQQAAPQPPSGAAPEAEPVAPADRPSQPDSYPATEPLPVDRPLELAPWQHPAHPAAGTQGQEHGVAAGGEAPFMHDPELEEAAIRFANGDYEGAEAVLLAQIAPGMAGIEREQIWLTLFDLYRATGRHDRFDNIAIDFASRFGRSAPVWFAMQDAPDQPLAADGPSVRAGALPRGRGFSWTAPDEVQAKTLSTLDAALATAPRPWRLNWSRVVSIDAPALDLLLQLVRRWCAQPIELRFVGSDHLMRLLADAAPPGDAAADPRHWRLRMELLRLMGQPEQFEEVALDYCITYEISPPSWIAPECSYREVDRDGIVAPESKPEAEAGLGFAAADSQPLPELVDAQELSLQLQGQLVGDAGAALARLEQEAAGRRVLAVRCDRLARVDFSAAGSMLNWVAAHHAQGRQVEFSHVQRLVAVFFNVIGINEYARILPRRN